MNNGPVITASQIYLDLLTYKSGVYQHLEGTKKFRGLQMFKIIGWDVDSEDNTFWIAENTWGKTWGENGLIKFSANLKKEKTSFFGQMTFAPRPRQDLPDAKAKKAQKAKATTGKIGLRGLIF